MKKRVELLAPAGNYEAFLGAVNAGADAVYLGGDRYGARAYADNFTHEEICRAIRTAHFMGKKIYLTVNTLTKDKELSALYEWLLPIYEAGLDGVIVQDIGVLCYIREHFKGLALHASTQMTLTGMRGADFLKEQGAERIVPARELSLEEVRGIKEKTGLEIECFIHGAMCYCYSGQCLFSSMLGGRSGNRGRCAQPCRLPYRICEGNEQIRGVDYPLSLKDMCTISYIPQLIEAGIDSFKIEGRMKKPEYTAGVTEIYRRYIDLYEAKGAAGYHVDDEDLENLRKLYIRSEVQTGYYERHNGREMITLDKPGYEGSDQRLLNQLRDRYVRDVDKLPVKMHVTLTAGEPACLEIMGPRGISATVIGDTVEPARKMPLQSDNIRKHLEKTGNSMLKVTDCEIIVNGDVFLPVGALNELRRKGVEIFERQYISMLGMASDRKINDAVSEVNNVRPTGSVDYIEKISYANRENAEQCEKERLIDILVSTYDQFTAAVMHPCRRVYIDSDLFLSRYKHISGCMEEHAGIEYFLALPYILRERDEDYMRRLTELLVHDKTIRGFLVRNYEEAAYVLHFEKKYKMVPDAGLYIFNRMSVDFWFQYTDEYTLPYELNSKEIRNLVSYAHSVGANSTMIVYGRIPMMISANCIRKTSDRCNKGVDGVNEKEMAPHSVRLKDRYGAFFPVETNCIHCYNIIYNSVPYSLHLQREELIRTGADIWRYDFTMESGEDCALILEKGKFPYEEYTTGHIKRGVE